MAEELVFDEVTTGAGNDLEQATEIARTMVTRYGMSEKLGPRTFGKREELVFLGREISERRDYGESVAETIDEEVFRLIDTAQKTARSVLEEHRSRLDRISKYLLEHETIEEDQVKEVFDTIPPAADMSPAPMPAD